jgi:uncharacterized protein
MKATLLVLLWMIITTDGKASNDPLPIWKPVIANTVQDSFISADLERLDGLLEEHIRINLQKRLLQIDTATILSGFEHRPGKQTWIGEHVGKFLYSSSRLYQYTHDPSLKKLMDAVAASYVQTQLPDGYLGTYLLQDRWTAWDVWAHKYAIIGLLNYYAVTGNTKSLEVAEKAADLICRTFGDGQGQLDLMRSGEHAGLAPGSILEPMVDLYRYTGHTRYLNFAKYILRAFEQADGPKIMTNLTRYGSVDSVGDAKAYEMLSCFVGMLKYYRLTGELKYLKTLQAAWQDIVNNRLYITGTASAREVFHPDYQLPAETSDHMGEGCVTVTWIQFNEQLLKISGQAKYAEEMEKAIYNQLLGAESPQTGCVSYYTALQGVKPYRCDQGYSCCLSSVPRGIAMIPGLVWGKLDHGFGILLYEPGQVRDSIRTQDGSSIELSIEASSTFPLGTNFHYRVDPSVSDKEFTIRFRIPSWAANYQLTVNGIQQASFSEQYVLVSRKWRRGDEISIHFDMPLQILHGGPSYPNAIAFKVGPQVLAIDSLVGPWTQHLQPLPSDLIGHYTLRQGKDLLPTGWIGSQVFVLTAKDQGRMQQRILVPFADASQLGSSIRVWLPVAEDSTPSN